MTTATTLAFDLLHRWLTNADEHWYYLPVPDEAGHALGCYGSGYNSWGVQTNQKYVAAAAAVATLGEHTGVDRQWALQRALTALRFSLASHLANRGACTDGKQWGNTWISALGVERMMFAVHLLEPHFDEHDRASLRRMLTHEANWIFHHHRRGSHDGIQGDRWASSGRNNPESNLWNGALLWRTACMYPDHPDAERWREHAVRFLVNAVSVPADADDETMVDGRPVREWFVGGNFFPNYALDHHRYLNVGYMGICVSNAAMLHFDLRANGLPRPQSLDHHQRDLWQVLRRMLFSDGRLARIGGDSRVRYAYCQEYLLPSLLYAADHLGDGHALALAQRQIELVRHEAQCNADGSFYGRRLRDLQQQNPYYYTRIESDRACALAMYLAYLPLVQAKATESSAERFEASVAGGWCEPEHGAVMHRSGDRLASFAWRAHGLTQAICQPPDASDLAEWEQNLVSAVEFVHHKPGGAEGSHRRLLRHHVELIAGGFITCGSVAEGVDVFLAEGWSGTDLAEHQMVYAALPDGRTMLALAFCRTAPIRTFLRCVKGVHLQLPNDLYNGFARTIHSDAGTLELRAPAAGPHSLSLPGRWLNIDNRLGLLALHGQGELAIERSDQQRAGRLGALYVEHVCFGCRTRTFSAEPASVVLDIGFAVASNADAQQTRALLERSGKITDLPLPPDVRSVDVEGFDGRRYLLLANFSGESASVPLPTAMVALVTGDRVQRVEMAPGTGMLLGA